MVDYTSRDEDAKLSAWVDEIADRFEADWQRGTPPRIDSYLEGVAAEQRLALLRELVKLDLAYRIKQGEKCQATAYLRAFPELQEPDPTPVREAAASKPYLGAYAPRLADVPPLANDSAWSTLRPSPSSTADTKAQYPHVRGYEILGELGHGGMGVVYKARQVNLNRVVALKMILAGVYAGAQEVARFRIEGEAAARLEHPHIVHIYEVGDQEGRPYCAMEFLDGGSLAQKLTGTPQPVRVAAQFVETLARAVQYAHEHHVVHRDLKPANILLAGTHDLPLERCLPKIADFGLAKQLNDGAAGNAGAAPAYQTQTGEILGTPSYMAPEQAEGKHREIGPAADIYALGAILYELLTGRPPFKGESTLDTLEQERTQEPLPPSRLQPRLPRDLSTICLKALAKAPGRRYAGAGALADDLRRYLDGRPIEARPVSAGEKLWRWCRRNPGVAGLAAAVVLLLVIGTGFSTFWIAQANEQAKETAREKERAQDEQRKSFLQAYISSMRLAQVYWDASLIELLRETLDSQLPENTGEEDLRGFEWYYWQRRCHSEWRTLRGQSVGVMSVAFSPDGQRLASGSLDATVKVWDLTNGNVRRTLTGHSDGVTSVAFSPDSRYLASGSSDQTVKVWDVTRGQMLQTLAGHTHQVTSVAYSPDGRHIVSGSHDLTVRVWDWASGKLVHKLTGHIKGISGVAVSADGQRVAGGGGKKVIVWDLASGHEICAFASQSGDIQSVAFSPDGRHLGSGHSDKMVHVWDLDGGDEPQVLRGHSRTVNSVTFSPDGQRIATASGDWTVKVWDVASGEALRTLAGHAWSFQSVAFSPDGRRLASASHDGMIKLWNEASGAEALTLKGYHVHIYSVAFSPDGRRLATGSEKRDEPGGEIRIWNATNGQTVLQLPGHSEAVNGVAFSPDGHFLASASDDKTVKVWDLTSAQARTFTGHLDKVWSAVFSPDGRSLASGSEDKTVILWDVASGRPLATLKGPIDRVNGVAFSPDGRRLATASWDYPVVIWDVTEAKPLTFLEGHIDSVWSVAFSPDGRWLASAGNDRTIRLWDTTTAQLVRTLKGHTDAISGVAFSPDGKRLASAGWDQTVKIWDPVSGQETLTLKGHRDRVFSVAFSPDGERLASASWDGTVRIWDATPVAGSSSEAGE
jgi:WD40 repeat protein